MPHQIGPEFPAGNTILIVDDDTINRELLSLIFSPYYSIEQAADGYEGLSAIEDHADRLCAVLLDVVMPVFDGLQVLHRLSQYGLPKTLPIFLITAEASGQVMQEAYRLGVMDVIQKPVVPYVVLRRVQSVVELFQARRQLSRVVADQQEDLLQQADFPSENR